MLRRTTIIGASIFFMIMHPPSPLEASEDWNVPFFYHVMHPLSSSDESDDAHRQNENNYHYPSFRELQTSLRHYREMADGIIRKLSVSHEVARRTEQILFPHHDHSDASRSSFLSCRLEEKITKSAILLEQNSLVLERLLKPFSFSVIARYSTASGASSKSPDISDLYLSTSTTNTHFTFPPPKNNNFNYCQTSPDSSMQSSLARYIPPYKPSQGIDAQDLDEAIYDSASHILTHLVRDWTASGQNIRKDTHDWILDQLLTLNENCNSMDSNLDPSSHCERQKSLSPVLVPGAGMARLAFDIAFAHGEHNETNNMQYYPFSVEAADNSIVMAAAAYHIFHYYSSIGNDPENALEIFPFVADPLSNEVNSQQRWKSEVIPEDIISQKISHLQGMQQSSNHQPNLSYSIGDFVSVYASPSKHALFGSIATCFFIDTATNIYEYILTIRNLLRVGGVWINVGPVQWHRNAQLQPTVDELKEIITFSGFKVIHWEISDKLLAYRHPDDISIGTRAEAYRPLKFVVALHPDEDCKVKTAGEEELMLSIEMLRRTTGRRSIFSSNKMDDH